jgi:type I restriction enzyme M protein
MTDKIVWQITDSLQASAPLRTDEALELALLILVWAKLSSEGQLRLDLCLDSVLANEPDRAVSILASLGDENAVMMQALAMAKSTSRLAGTSIRPALDLAARLLGTGVLQNLDAADAVIGLPGREAGAYSSPPEVADLMIQLADIRAEETIYVPWDFGSQFAARVMRSGAAAYVETPVHSALPMLVGLLVGSAFEVHYGDPIRTPSAINGGKPRCFDAAVAFPPIGVRYDLDVVDHDWFARFPERTQSGTVLAVRHLLAQANRCVVVAVPNSLLFSTGAEFALRADLLKGGKVRAVVAMPAGLLAFANIPFTVLILDPAGGHQQVRFINADTPRFRDPISKARARLANIEALSALTLGTAESEDVALILISDVLANDAQLQVSRYVLPDSTKKLQARMAQSETVALGDLVTTIRPMPTTLSGEDGVEVREVGAADLPPFGYLAAPARTVKIERDMAIKNKQQFLLPYDIVIIVKGSVGKLGIVPTRVPPPGEGGWVAGQSAIVLRARERIGLDPRVIALQLRSPLGQELINGIVSGASIQLIQLKELSRLAVLLPDMASQAEAVEALEQEARIQEEIDRLKAAQALVADHLWNLK